MMDADPYTIRIFVPEGDPEGVRIIDRMNWTGLGLVVPRGRWDAARSRPEFERPGVYILSGYETDEIGVDRLVLYIGQAEDLRTRINQHLVKEFWDRLTVFVSANNGLNRAHITWLEWALIVRAKTVAGCRLENGNQPGKPGLSESEEADTRGFLKEVLRILPLVGLRVFEQQLGIPAKLAAPVAPLTAPVSDKDTIVVPAQPDGFKEAFLGQNAWWAIRIGQSVIPKLRWIAAYQTQPVSQVTHYAEIDRIEPYGEAGKYKVFFKGPPVALEAPIPFGGATSGAMQGPRYTSLSKLKQAKTVKDLTW